MVSAWDEGPVVGYNSSNPYHDCVLPHHKSENAEALLKKVWKSKCVVAMKTSEVTLSDLSESPKTVSSVAAHWHLYHWSISTSPRTTVSRKSLFWTAFPENNFQNHKHLKQANCSKRRIMLFHHSFFELRFTVPTDFIRKRISAVAEQNFIIWPIPYNLKVLANFKVSERSTQ